MGGGSPILPETVKQADALEVAIRKRVENVTFKCFPAMRYWKPFVKNAAQAAADWGATDAILLPLYPQYSSTTTGSSLAAWRKASHLPAATICCYPQGDAFAAAHAEAIREAWRLGGSPEKPRVLFSAHGLPQSVIDRGDPYQFQVERTVAAVRWRLPTDWETRICYQSRVGPMKWLGPSTEEEIRVAGRDKTGVIVSPIAFVSEHVETLVELDIEYAHNAKTHGVPFYLRAAAPGSHPSFIDALADMVEHALASPRFFGSGGDGGRICPGRFGGCPQTEAAAVRETA